MSTQCHGKRTCFNHGPALFGSGASEWKSESKGTCGVSVNNDVINFNKCLLRVKLGNNQRADWTVTGRLSRQLNSISFPPLLKIISDWTGFKTNFALFFLIVMNKLHSEKKKCTKHTPENFTPCVSELQSSRSALICFYPVDEAKRNSIRVSIQCDPFVLVFCCII